ncbi:hypothetical protein ACQJBY_051558 [Aegilops geniculata]
MAGAAPHVMVLPFPAQGHVTPLMELSHRLVDHGLRVTFVCTEPIHKLLLGALRRNADDGEALDGIRLVSIPDGLADGDDRRDLCKFLDGISRCIPGYVEQLIRETKVRWLVGDANMGLCFEVAKKLGVRVACVFPASAAGLGTLLRLPQLIEDGFFDDRGRNDEARSRSPTTCRRCTRRTCRGASTAPPRGRRYPSGWCPGTPRRPASPRSSCATRSSTRRPRRSSCSLT